MKILGDFPKRDDSLTQTLPRDIEAKINKEASETSLSEEDIKRKTKTYEPKPLTPQDPLYDKVMEQFGSRPVKPKYWFEEFGEFWSCSCGHINKGDTCVGCGLDRNLLRQLFILHKPSDKVTDLSEKVSENKEEIEKQAQYQKLSNDRRRANKSTDLTNIKPINPGSSHTETNSSNPSNDSKPSADNNKNRRLLYTELTSDQLGEPQKKLPKAPRLNLERKKKILIGIITAALIFALGGGYWVYENIATPALEYDKAVQLMQNGDYSKAIEAFEGLENYKDCEKLIEECTDILAYEDAIKLMQSGKYTEAIKAFEALAGYKDSVKQVRNCYIKLGDKKMSDFKFTEAISEYEKAQDIKNSNEIKDKINEAKYAYIKARISVGGKSLESFLHDLKEISYPGINEMYDKYYAWRVKIVANDNEGDYSTDEKSLETDDDIYFHTSISGGEPNEKIRLYYVITWPSGKSDTQQLDSDWKSGSRITAHFSYPIRRFGKAGDMTFSLYDAESNDKLGSKTIKLKKD